MTMLSFFLKCGDGSKICKSINLANCKKQDRKIKKHIIISIDSEKAFDKIHHRFMIKVIDNI